MLNWRDECRRDDAINRIGFTIFIGCVGIILVGITGTIWGLWIPTIIGIAIGWCVVVGLPLLFKGISVLRDKVVDFLDKKWENWWKYL